MARKERKKKVKLTGIGYELVGILLVLLSILMIGQLGIIGTFLKKLGVAFYCKTTKPWSV